MSNALAASVWPSEAARTFKRFEQLSSSQPFNSARRIVFRDCKLLKAWHGNGNRKQIFQFLVTMYRNKIRVDQVSQVQQPLFTSPRANKLADLLSFPVFGTVDS